MESIIVNKQIRLSNTTKTKGRARKPQRNISTNLRALVTNANMSEHELSRKTGIKQPIIHRLLSGENTNPKLATLRPLTEFFMITVSQLIGEDNIDAVWSGMTAHANLGWNDISVLCLKQLKSSKRKELDVINVNCDITEMAYAVAVSDESMEPLIPNSSYVIVEPNLLPNDGDCVIVKIAADNKVVIRQILSIGNKQYVTPFNRKYGTTKIIDKKDKILGAIVRTIYRNGIDIK